MPAYSPRKRIGFLGNSTPVGAGGGGASDDKLTGRFYPLWEEYGFLYRPARRFNPALANSLPVSAVALGIGTGIANVTQSNVILVPALTVTAAYAAPGYAIDANPSNTWLVAYAMKTGGSGTVQFGFTTTLSAPLTFYTGAWSTYTTSAGTTVPVATITIGTGQAFNPSFTSTPYWVWVSVPAQIPNLLLVGSFLAVEASS